MDTDFQNSLSTLNEAQKQAVFHDSGPLLIVAGAGTGKTRVITSRILHLIESEKAASNEILALTFTEKAAEEMVERVDIAMPLGYEPIWIKTFHGFCEKVLRESGNAIGVDPSYKVLDKLAQWIFVKKRVFDFDLDYFRPLGNPGSYIDTLVTHFGRIKEECISPDEYIEYAKKKLLEVEGKKELSKQEVVDKKSVLGIEIEEAKKTLEIAQAYARYQELLKAENFLDFGDLSYLVLKLFEEKPEILAKYRARFKYVMVDEFQDTNYAQFKLIMLLCSGGTQNICVVGDDDQSIFRWRGASLSNILQFQKTFPSCKQIVLTENYRSNQNILDASHSFIKFNDPDRLEARDNISKDLKSQTDENIPIKAMHFSLYEDEVSFVVGEISKIVKNGGDFGDIAILVRSNANAMPFAEALKKADIPYYIRNPKGLLSYEEIKDIAAAIRVIADEDNDIALMRVLQFPMFEIPLNEITAVFEKASRERIHVIKIIENLADDAGTVLPGMESPLLKFLYFLDRVKEYAKDKSAGEVINYFLKEIGYLERIAKEFSPETQDKLNNITAFSKIVYDFEQASVDDEKSISDFASYLKMIEDSNIPLVDKGGSALENGAGGGDSDSVKILTTHGAKGLEFETVFVVNLVNHRFPILGRKESLSVPQELTKEIFPDGDYHIEEERRLFYVALTRAKRNLILTYSDKYDGAKKWKKSQFLDEVIESGLVSEEEVPSHEGLDFGKEVEDGFENGAKRQAPKIISTAPKKILSGSFSYSRIDTFKTCPLKYAYRYSLGVQTPPSHAANFGTSMHETLKDFYRNVMNSGDTSFGIMLEFFEKNWISLGYESVKHEDARKNQGLKILREFYEKNSPFIVPAHIERNFNIKIGDNNFTGRIDRIDRLSDGTYEVIDYKTGRSKELTTEYKLQLSVYALACVAELGAPASKLSLYFLDDNEKISMKKIPSDLGSVKDDILYYIDQMKSSKFGPTPGFHCSFCDYRLICPAV